MREAILVAFICRNPADIPEIFRKFAINKIVLQRA